MQPEQNNVLTVQTEEHRSASFPDESIHGPGPA